MGLQEQFEKFNDKIKLSESDKGDLRDKREKLIDKLRSGGNLPGFDECGQGSYAMHLGVKPIDDREYDIDVALRFHADKDEADPFEYKQTIFEDLKKHTEYGATIKKPCVTVTYKKGGTAAFHVDLVPYVYDDHYDTSSQMYIAKGKISGDSRWEMADPVALVEYIDNAVEGGDARDQFRRVVRYLKRWKMRRFDSGGHSEPPSIGITLIAVDNFTYYEDDDLQATIDVCKAIQREFFHNGFDDDGHSLFDIKYGLPVDLRFEPDSDVFEKMTLSQKTGFKEKMYKLVRDLEDVADEPDLVEQCRKLNKIFGDDFELLDERDASRTQNTFIPMTSSSG